MIGFVVGALFALFVMKMARRRRYWAHGHGRMHGHGHWHGHGHGHAGWHGHHGWCGQRGRGGWGDWGEEDSDERPRRRGFLGGLFDRLETTPAQEREIRSALDDVKQSVRGAKRHLRETKDDLASAFRSEDLDVEVLGELLAKQDSALDDIKKELAGAVAQVHATLDQDQRERLARFLERMGPTPRWA